MFSGYPYGETPYSSNKNRQNFIIKILFDSFTVASIFFQYFLSKLRGDGLSLNDSISTSSFFIREKSDDVFLVESKEHTVTAEYWLFDSIDTTDYFKPINRLIDSYIDDAVFLIDEESVVGGTFANGYEYRRQISFNSAKYSTSADMQNFPLLIDISSPDFQIRFMGGKLYLLGAGQVDIRFESASGAVLPYEFISLSGAGRFRAWVKVNLAVDGYIYMYYGNPDSSTNGRNTAAVWSDFHLVYHLDTLGEVLNTQGDTVSVYVSNNADPGNTNYRLTNDSGYYPFISGGKVNTSIGFLEGELAGSDFSFLDSTDYTVLGWFAPTSNSSGYGFDNIISLKPNSPYTVSDHAFYLYYGLDNDITFTVDHSTDGTKTVTYTPEVINQWNHFAVKISENEMEAFVNNTALPNSPIAFSGYNANSAYKLTLGHEETRISMLPGFLGSMDEIWIAKTALSDEYISALYENQNDPYTFYTVSDIQNPTPLNYLYFILQKGIQDGVIAEDNYETFITYYKLIVSAILINESLTVDDSVRIRELLDSVTIDDFSQRLNSLFSSDVIELVEYYSRNFFSHVIKSDNANISDIIAKFPQKTISTNISIADRLIRLISLNRNENVIIEGLFTIGRILKSFVSDQVNVLSYFLKSFSFNLRESALISDRGIKFLNGKYIYNLLKTFFVDRVGYTGNLLDKLSSKIANGFVDRKGKNLENFDTGKSKVSNSFTKSKSSTDSDFDDTKSNQF